MISYINILQEHCQQNKYFEIYKNICKNSLLKERPNIYEKHHILPKCFKLGGNIDKNNIVYLSPREHFVCHKLLLKFVIDIKIKASLTYALWQMTKRYQVNSKEYEKLKQLLSLNTKNIKKSEEHKNNLRKQKSNTENMGHKKGWNNPLKGLPLPDNIKQKISKSKKGKTLGTENHFYGKHHTDETKQILRNYNIGKTIPDNVRQQISKTLKGRPTWNKGLSITKECSDKIKTSLSGRKNINNGIINKRIKSIHLENYLNEGWKLGFLYKNPYYKNYN